MQKQRKFFDVQVYDNGGKTADRYTVKMLNEETGEYDIYGMSEEPSHPQGFNQYSHTVREARLARHRGWGKKLKWVEIPYMVRKAIDERLEGY